MPQRKCSCSRSKKVLEELEKGGRISKEDVDVLVVAEVARLAKRALSSEESSAVDDQSDAPLCELGSSGAPSADESDEEY